MSAVSAEILCRTTGSLSQLALIHVMLAVLKHPLSPDFYSYLKAKLHLFLTITFDNI
jgi:hypothetical protein